jgi:antitoxin FitA
MPNLLIRNVDPALHASLKTRAAAHHRSLEEEVRVLLRSGVKRPDEPAPKESLVAVARRLFGPENGVDLELPPRDWREDRPPPDFGPEPE